VEVVVVFRTHYASVSIYCTPTSPSAYGGKTVAGIPFAGHPKAAGSPRGQAISEHTARAVFDEIACPECGGKGPQASGVGPCSTCGLTYGGC